MTTMSLQLPPDVLEQAKALAGDTHTSVEELLVTFIAEGLRQRRTFATLRERAARADMGAALAILDRAPNVPPEAGDEMPAGQGSQP